VKRHLEDSSEMSNVSVDRREHNISNNNFLPQIKPVINPVIVEQILKEEDMTDQNSSEDDEIQREPLPRPESSEFQNRPKSQATQLGRQKRTEKKKGEKFESVAISVHSKKGRTEDSTQDL